MKKCNISLIIILSILFFGCNNNEDTKPNILLIMTDDLNDYNEVLKGHPQAITPNIKKLSDSGTSFMKAYTNNPICGPSRSSFLSGVYPHNSLNFWQKPWYNNDVLANTKTIVEKFKENGYYVLGSGKILHHNRKELWSEFEHNSDLGPVAYKGKKEKGKIGISHPDIPKPFRTERMVGCCNMNGGQIDGSFGPLKNVENTKLDGEQLSWAYGGSRGYKEFKYTNEDERDLTPDEINAQWAEDKINELARSDNNSPFFLAVGFVRPHTPLIAPQKYFDMYPLDEIQLANILEKDKEDTFFHDEDQFETKERRTRSIESYQNLIKSYSTREEGLKRFTQAYLACVTAVDDNIGKVVNAIDKSKFKENTIIVFVSDHGWTLGEKDHIYKNSPWEESTRVPLIIRAPRLTKPNTKVNHPVSLIDVYPTLLELAGLDDNTIKNDKGKSMDGFSLKPFLDDPNTKKWEGPDGALSVVYSSDKNENTPSNHHYSLRTKDWRYIIYSSGKEELYHNAIDPKEWNNLVYEKTHPKRDKMVKILKEITHPMVPNGLKKLQL